MKRRVEALEKMPLTSMVDITFQLMIFFLVTMSIMPSVKSAPQVEGGVTLATPIPGGTEVSLVIQLQRSPEGGMDYYVLQGNDSSGEFYEFLDKTGRNFTTSPLFRNRARVYNVLYDETGLRVLLNQLKYTKPKVLIRADRKIPYEEVVKIASWLQELGITKYGWVGGTLADLKAKIIKKKVRRL